jgi:GNAT superfamily N-acetyltransferase
MRVKLVAKPNKLMESTRHTLNVLDALCFPEDPLYPKDGCYWWIVFNERGSAIAFAGLKPLTGHNKGMAFLCRAGVGPEARGLGLQRRLIKTRVSYARRLKLTQVITYTSRENYKSAANLLRSGLKFYTPVQEWGVAGALYFNMEF